MGKNSVLAKFEHLKYQFQKKMWLTFVQKKLLLKKKHTFFRRELKDQNIDWKNGITVCTRFNLMKLSQYVFYLGRRDLIAFHFTINYILGGDANRPSQGRIILEKDKKRIFYIPWFDHDPNDAEYVAVNIWHHVCISWDCTNSKISLIVVRTQCGNFMTFLSLRFYVKSILEIL